jgi:hypothetical protein
VSKALCALLVVLAEWRSGSLAGRAGGLVFNLNLKFEFKKTLFQQQKKRKLSVARPRGRRHWALQVELASGAILAREVTW